MRILGSTLVVSSKDKKNVLTLNSVDFSMICLMFANCSLVLRPGINLACSGISESKYSLSLSKTIGSMTLLACGIRAMVRLHSSLDPFLWIDTYALADPVD